MPSLLILYHYFHPDAVVSARLFSDIGAAFAQRGWRVAAWPCNRACHAPHQRHPARETWRGVEIDRVWRPSLNQSSSTGRIINALWMARAWRRRAAERRGPPPDVILIGTDPFFSLTIAPALKRAWPTAKIVHWCHDIYPEALTAGGLLSADNPIYRMFLEKMRGAYAACDLVAALGPCMTERLGARVPPQRLITLPPWALWEPEAPASADQDLRRKMFGNARLALLYSGNFGRAHQADGFMAMAGPLADAPVHFAFAARGHGVMDLQKARGRLRNVTITRMVDEEALGSHLGSADILLASLRPEWTGIVVPSKFFGALAAGRPVLFDGEPSSSIARWIEEYKVGWVIAKGNMPSIVAELLALSNRPENLQALRAHCHAVYREHFSSGVVLPAFERRLRDLAEPAA